MPHTHTGLPASSGFDSFSVPLARTANQSFTQSPSSSQQSHLTLDYPQTTAVAWQSGHPAYAQPRGSTSNSSTTKAMSTVAGPSSLGPSGLHAHPYSAAGQISSMPSVTMNPNVSSSNSWSSSNAVGYQFPNNASNQMASSMSSSYTAMQDGQSSHAHSNPQSHHPHHSHHHQHSNSLDNTSSSSVAATATDEQPSFLGHRRMNTDNGFSIAGGNYATMIAGDRSDAQLHVQNSPGPHSTPQSKPVTLGPIRVHQFFPTAGEVGVPVTVLATVSAEWARQVGLHLVNGIFGGHDSTAARSFGGSRFVICFGTTEVEARTERSIATSDSPFTTLTTLEGTAYQSGSSREVDLTINAFAPAYPGPQLQYPSLGGRVPIRIKLVGVPQLDATLQPLSTGLQVGEFCYWQVSPRSNLKRPGDDHLSEQHALRRPASFPALPPNNNEGGLRFSAGSGDASAGVQNFGMPQSLRRSGLSDSLGLNRMSSAHDFRSSQESNPTFQSNAMQQQQQQQQQLQQQQQQQGLAGIGQPSGSYAPFSAGSLSSTSPASSKRRTSLSFSSAGGMGPPSEMSRPSTDITPYPPTAKPSDYASGVPQSTPQLIRSTQLFSPTPASASTATSVLGNSGSGTVSMGGSGHSHNPSSVSSSSNSPPTDRSGLPIPPSQRATLDLHGNVLDMAVGWSHDEWRARRRLVQFWRKQEGTTIHAICKPILPEQYVPNSVVVSCIFWDVTNECYITSVDIIYLLEALVASRFNVEEKNRIRRNLEGLKPKTISKIAKSGDEKLNRIHEEFFKLVMGFPNPKPRHIEKDIKIFPWRVVPSALNKIISKYSAAPLVAAAAAAASDHQFGGDPMQAHMMQQGAGMSATPMMMPSMDAGGPSGANSAPSFTSPHLMQHQQQQQQQSQQRRFNGPQPGLSIDVGMSNASFVPQSAPPVGGYGGSQQQQQQQQPQQMTPNSSSLLYPPLGTPARGLGIGLASSPRKSLSSNFGLPGSSTFNFSDFVVSPSAFGQTPLQQAQSLASSHMPQPPGSSGGGGGSGANSHGGGLGMDLGNVYKHDQ